MSWIEIKAQLPAGPDASPYVEIFRDHGIDNTMEDGAMLIGALTKVPGVEHQIEELKRNLAAAGAVSVATRDLPEENWEVAWKKFFKPRRVGRHFLVRPTWEQARLESEDVEIVLDPGQAFGTGDHPTTRLCMELIEDADMANARVCDVGCGSGILAVAACKLGACQVFAVDVDPVAVEVAIENAKLNQVSFHAQAAEGIKTMGAEFDIVLSNIISAILIRLARDVFEALNPGGRWIVSGIISANWPDVNDAARRAGFSLRIQREEDGWVAALFDKA